LGILNKESNAPVDIAAVCKNWDVVEVFMNDLKNTLEKGISPR